ncbi:MAG: hypothetical protein NTX86_00390 [Candidatus Dependentiae bacterium]|nr:hypothetical protein [Candidatus Dependentiae bacterium]
MGRYVQIKKYKKEDSVNFYEVSSPDYSDVKQFFISIDAEKKTICFFKTNNFSLPDYTMILKLKLCAMRPYILCYDVVYHNEEALNYLTTITLDYSFNELVDLLAKMGFISPGIDNFQLITKEQIDSLILEMNTKKNDL